MCPGNKLMTWQIQLRDLMGDEREPVNDESPIHQIGSCFVRKWRPMRNQNIIIFPKKCVYKLKNINSVIFFFEKLCRHRPQTYLSTSPNNWGPPGRERYGDPEPSLQLVEIVPAKKRNPCYDQWSGYLCNFSWKAVKHRCWKVSEMMVQHLATEWHWSPVSVRWP